MAIYIRTHTRARATAVKAQSLAVVCFVYHHLDAHTPIQYSKDRVRFTHVNKYVCMYVCMYVCAGWQAVNPNPNPNPEPDPQARVESSMIFSSLAASLKVCNSNTHTR